MGNSLGRLNTTDGWWGVHIPEPDDYAKINPKPLDITHDPMEGFPRGRKPRVMVATEAEMHSANLTLKQRDYCAHKLIAFKSCRYEKFPFVYRCAREKDELHDCLYDDHILRLKEHERERRLRERDAARAQQAAA